MLVKGDALLGECVADGPDARGQVDGEAGWRILEGVDDANYRFSCRPVFDEARRLSVTE